MALQTDFMVVVEVRPAVTASIGGAFRAVGVNVESVCGLSLIDLADE